MKILFVSSGGKERGSFTVRGRQLAAAMGAESSWNPTWRQIDSADLVVVVKSVSDLVLDMLRERRKPWVWDILDAYKQPEQSQMPESEARAWLSARIETLKPRAVVCTTSKMQEDIWLGNPTIETEIFPHHGWARPLNPIREKASIVGYEGRLTYLEGWLPAINSACINAGLGFALSPPEPRVVDILVAVRGGQWDGYPSRAWKSNVKLANAQITGTPIICQRTAAYEEFSNGGVQWVEKPEDFTAALEALMPYAVRKRASEMLLKDAIRVEDVARTYRKWLENLV